MAKINLKRFGTDDATSRPFGKSEDARQSLAETYEKGIGKYHGRVQELRDEDQRRYDEQVKLQDEAAYDDAVTDHDDIAQGMAMGSSFGPWGTLAGAIIGKIKGSVSMVNAMKKRGAKDQDIAATWFVPGGTYNAADGKWREPEFDAQNSSSVGGVSKGIQNWQARQPTKDKAKDAMSEVYKSQDDPFNLDRDSQRVVPDLGMDPELTEYFGGGGQSSWESAMGMPSLEPVPGNGDPYAELQDDSGNFKRFGKKRR